MKKETKEKIMIIAKQVASNEVTDADVANALRKIADSIEEEK